MNASEGGFACSKKINEQPTERVVFVHIAPKSQLTEDILYMCDLQFDQKRV